MVSLQDSSISNSSSSSSKWFMGRSMRTIRSNLYQTQPSSIIHSSSSAASAVYHSENLTDSVIDLRLRELSTASNSPNSPIEEDHSFLLLDLDLSQAFSACSSSDISGELRRLASTSDNHHSLDSNQQQQPPTDEPCPGFLDRESFSTEIMESISPEDLQPTVKLCVDSLVSPSTAVKRSAAAKLRLLAKNRADNRALIGESGAVPALIQLLRSTDPRTQEHAVTALLNLSLHDGNKDLMSRDPVAIKALIYVLKTGTETSKQNAACALLNLSLMDEGSRMTIGACGAIPPLVTLLINGTTRGKKDAMTTLYKLCGAKVNKERAVSAGAVGPLVRMVTKQQEEEEEGKGMAEKAMVVLSSLAGIEQGREAIVEEGGIAGLVEAIEQDSSSDKGKEFAVMTLLQLCGDSVRNRALLVREGAIPPLAALSQSGTIKAKHKAETLLRYLREPRQEASTSTSP